MAILPHGVDGELFYPLLGELQIGPGRRQARALLFPDRPELQDAFIVLNANRNCPRKRIDLTLDGFAAFAEKAGRDAWLYLHMGMRDSGIDVRHARADRFRWAEIAEHWRRLLLELV